MVDISRSPNKQTRRSRSYCCFFRYHTFFVSIFFFWIVLFSREAGVTKQGEEEMDTLLIQPKEREKLERLALTLR
ncbi:MAG: hypothetical protein Q8P67_13290, partial [archaeon]|nr:hypothetical protein [archaeon]